MDNNKTSKYTDFSLGFDAGNYANAYETTDLAIAILSSDPSDTSDAYCAGLVLGFYSSYELDEIPATDLDAYETALAEYGTTPLTEVA
jgi:hypothetical protein